VPKYLNPFGIIIQVAITPMGIFVSVFAVKHVFIVTKGLTTKQLHSIKAFEEEALKQNMKIEGLRIVKDQIEELGEAVQANLGKNVQIGDNGFHSSSNAKYDLYNRSSSNNNSNGSSSSSSNSSNHNSNLYNKLTLKDRLRNLWKFYTKSIPDSIV